MLNLGPWLRCCLSGFSSLKLLFFPLSYSALWHKVTVHTLQFASWDVLHLRDKEWLNTFLEFFTGALSCLVYFSNHLFILLWSCKQVLILQFIIQYFIFYFGAQIISALATGDSFNWLLGPLAILSLCVFHVCLLKRKGILCILLILKSLLRG